jgi:hypothetical protein
MLKTTDNATNNTSETLLKSLSHNKLYCAEEKGGKKPQNRT